MITLSTLIDEDPDSTVNETNTAFDDVSAITGQSFGGTTLGLSQLSAPLVFLPPNQLQYSYSDESERKKKQLSDNSEETNVSEILSLVADKDDPSEENFQSKSNAYVHQQTLSQMPELSRDT